MRRLLFLDDDSLPTWLHTLALLLVASPFGVPLIWIGVRAILSRHLDPVSGPEFGQFFFGPTALQGKEAVWAGMSLVVLGISFFSLAASFMRVAQGNLALCLLPWALIAASIAFGLPVGRHG